jgi:hypothetical protein
MELIEQKTSKMLDALKTLSRSIELFHKYQHTFIHNPTLENEELSMATRESMIQRFEYNTDFFWKIIKIYLENQGVTNLTNQTAKGL